MMFFTGIFWSLIAQRLERQTYKLLRSTEPGTTYFIHVPSVKLKIKDLDVPDLFKEGLGNCGKISFRILVMPVRKENDYYTVIRVNGKEAGISQGAATLPYPSGFPCFVLHLPVETHGIGPAHGNQRSEWEAGCRFDHPNPEHR